MRGFPSGSASKESTCNSGDPGLIPGSGWFPWWRKWQPTPVFLPGKSHGWRSLAVYSPWDCRVRHDWLTSLSLYNERQKTWYRSSIIFLSLNHYMVCYHMHTHHREAILITVCSIILLNLNKLMYFPLN